MEKNLISKMLSLLFIASLLIMIQSSFASAQDSSETQDFTLYGSTVRGWGFTEVTMSIPGPEISFEEGVPVNITLISADGVLHDFFVDYNGNGAIDSDEPHSPTFSSTTVFQFTPDRTGQFTYYCSFHPSTMNGNTQIVPELTPAFLAVLMVVLAVTGILYKIQKQPQKLK